MANLFCRVCHGGLLKLKSFGITVIPVRKSLQEYLMPLFSKVQFLPSCFSYYKLTTFPDDVAFINFIYTDDATLYSRCDCAIFWLFLMSFPIIFSSNLVATIIPLLHLYRELEMAGIIFCHSQYSQLIKQ